MMSWSGIDSCCDDHDVTLRLCLRKDYKTFFMCSTEVDISTLHGG
jgi:hypothetical protein